MSWFSSLFSTPSRGNPRTIDTSEAFSLPTGSPTGSPTQAEGDGSFTYPPTYGNSKSGAILPMHHTNGETGIGKTWHRLRTWLAREYPELGDTLNYGILPEELAALEMQFGMPLPACVRESYLSCDGQEPESAASSADGLFFGLSLLPLEDVLEEWRFWRIVDEDPTTGANAKLRDVMQSIPPGWVRAEYSQRGWIPLVADKTGNYIGIDLSPDEHGVAGQVIVFGRDFDAKVVLWRGDGADGWAKWLASFVEELELGETFEIGASVDVGSGSEDDVGYESYFYDGMGREGGEAGSGGGLRLTGDYRGWNVLEALADRSVRKWYDAGVISEAVLQHDEQQQHADPSSSTMPGQELLGAEVAIPVVADDEPIESSSALPAPTLNEIPPSPTSTTFLTQSVSQPNTPLPTQQLHPKSSSSTSKRIPTIAVTKPPAPMPVQLPTADDVAGLPSPPDSRANSFDDDLESGMREANQKLVSRPQSQGRMKRHPLEQEAEVDEFGQKKEPEGSKKKKEAREETVDLLTGDQPLVDTTVEIPLDKAPVPAPKPAEEEDDDDDDDEDDEDEDEEDEDDEDEDEEEEEAPSNTVRLVQTKTPALDEPMLKI